VSIKLDILGVRDYFKVIVAAEDAENHKPHPDLYLHTIDKLQVTAANCVVFEDSSAGVAAGCAAGCTVIGFTKYAQDKTLLNGLVKSIDSWSEITTDDLVDMINNVNKEY
jgi:beta-phosphoglucomutase-like phosphatase (HAD superfamily)